MKFCEGKGYILFVYYMIYIRTYSMKFMSLEWMLLKSGKRVRPVLKIPLNEIQIYNKP